MNAAYLLTHFDRIAAAPDAIPRLRRFVLDIAVIGKLVPQDPTDEPASELLKRIASGRSGRKVPSVEKAETIERSIAPSGWALATLGAVANVVMGQSPPGESYNKAGEGVPLINGPVEFSAGPFGVTTVNQYTTAPTNYCQKGDLLICVRGSTTGRTNIAGFRACIGRGVAAIQPLFDDSYLRLCIWRSRKSIIAMGRGIAFPSVSRKQIEDLVVPLPPLAEQHRIVAKVDELMSLCDQLEASLTEAATTRRLLLDALLTKALEPTIPVTPTGSPPKAPN